MNEKEARICKSLVVSVIAIALGIVVLPALAAGATISIEDGFAEVGGTDVVALMINDAVGVGSVEVNLTFDESVVTVTHCTDGDFDIPPQEPPTQTGPGWVIINAGQVWSPSLNGNVKICDVTLQAVGSGGDTSPLNLTDVVLQDMAQDPLPVDALINGTFRINGPPIPNITSPADGATISGVVTIEEVDESGEGDIAYNLFEYYYDENCNGEADDGNTWTEIYNDTDGSDGWSANWDTAALPDCCYIIRATMGDESGLTGTDTINVALSNHDPVPDITSPLEGATLTGTVTIEEVDTSFDQGADIAYNLFEYYYDKDCDGIANDGNTWTEIYNDTVGTDGWSANWETTYLPDCCYIIRATMGDKHGRTGTDTINVALSNHDPVPDITSPLEGATLTGLVTIEEYDIGFDDGADIAYNLFEYYYDENCDGIANDGNTWTEIYNDTVGTDGWSANWDTASVQDCCYIIRATMGDKHGRTGTDTINVALSNHDPVPDITSPAEGATLTGLVTIEEVDTSFDQGADIAYNLFEYYYDTNCNGIADDEPIYDGSSSVSMITTGWTEIYNDTVGSDGWSADWNTAELPDCCYIIRATMGDKHGRIGTDTINVVLSNHDPVPYIMTPYEGDTLTGLVTIEEYDVGFDGGADIAYNLFEYYYDTDCNGETDDGNTWTEIYNDTNGTDGWSADWDTAALPDCCYIIRVTMGDKHGRTGTDTINVALSNHAPEPNITSPANGSMIGGLVTIEETDESFDAGADIAYNLFEYYYDTNCNCVADDGNEWVEIGNDTSPEGGWSVQWDTRGLPIGCYMIRATMGDKHGLTGTDEINVEMDSIPPSVADANATPEIIPDDTDNDPTCCATIYSECSILNVTVTDDGSGVSGVTINLSQIGGSPVQPMTNIVGDIWSVSTNASAGTTPGTYDLVITATDTAGNSNTTETVSLRVQKNGDVKPLDGDGKVDFLGDAMYLLRHTRNVGGYEDIRENIADVTGDCKIDFLGDAMYLLRHTRNVGGYEILK